MGETRKRAKKADQSSGIIRRDSRVNGMCKGLQRREVNLDHEKPGERERQDGESSTLF